MDLKQFLQLFDPRPGNRYIQITDKEDEITVALREILQKVDGELHLVYYGDDTPKSEQSDKVQCIANFDTPFRALPREHDIVIFQNILHKHQKSDLLLKIAYSTLANNANIIVLQDKNTMDIEAMKEKLENFEFRASNYINVLSTYDLVMAKKMHMWGNGL